MNRVQMIEVIGETTVQEMEQHAIEAEAYDMTAIREIDGCFFRIGYNSNSTGGSFFYSTTPTVQEIK